MVGGVSTALDAPLLQRYARARRHPWWAHATVPLLTLVGFVAVAVATTTDVPCTPADPCSPDLVVDLGTGAVLAGTALVRWSGWAALATTVVGGLLGTTVEDGPWTAAALAGHVLVLALVVRARRPTLPVPAATARPALPAPPSDGRPFAVGAVLAAVLALALAGLHTGLLAHEQGRERAAAQEQAVVTAHTDEYTVVLAPPGSGAGRTEVEVLDAAEHPVGSQITVWRLADGSLRAVAEPYDPWGAGTGAGIAAALAVGLLGARAQRRARRRRFATGPLPVVAARARVLPGVAFVYAVDADPCDEPVLVVPLAVDGPEPVDLTDPGVDGHDDADDDDDEGFEDLPEVVDVLLAGVPVPGRWCAVSLGGSWLAPGARSVAGTGGPPLVLDDDPLDADGLPVLAVPVRDLAPADVVPRDGAVDRTAVHRRPPVLTALAVLPPLVAAVAGPEWVQALVDSRTARVAVVGVVGLLVLELAWRFGLRPRLGWDHDGLVVVGARGPARRYAWRALVVVEPVDALGLQLVLLDRPDDPDSSDVAVRVVATADPHLPRALRRGWRTGPQLRAALLQARADGDPGLHGCELSPAPVRPWELWPLWVLALCVTWVVAG